MFNVDVNISADLEISLNGAYEKFESPQGTLYLFGNLYGSFKNEKVLSKAETIQLFLEGITEPGRLVSAVQSTGGDYYLVIKTKDFVRLLSSANTPGLFYRRSNQGLHLSNIFDDVVIESSLENLNQDQVFNFIFSGHSIRPAFETFFSDVKRTPGASYLTVTRGLEISRKLYVKQSYEEFSDNYIDLPDDKKYDLFKHELDAATKLIANWLGDRKVYMMVSGGADSCMMIAAFLKAGIKPIAINWQSGGSQGRWQNVIIEKMSKDMGFEYIVLKGDPLSDIKKPEDLEAFYKEDLFEIQKNPYIQLYKYFRDNQIKDPLVFTGQNLDGFFEFFTSFKSANIGLRSNPLEFLVRRMCDTLGTHFFFGNIFKFKWIFQLMTRGKIRYPYYDYILAMSNNLIGFETHLPYAILRTLNEGKADCIAPWSRYPNLINAEVVNARKKSLGPINFNAIHLGIQENTVLKNLLSTEDVELLKTNRPLAKATYFNHLVRLMKYLNAHQPFILKYTTISRKMGYELKNFADQDYLRRFCVKYNRNSIKDLLLPKRFKYSYAPNVRDP